MNRFTLTSGSHQRINLPPIVHNTLHDPRHAHFVTDVHAETSRFDFPFRQYARGLKPVDECESSGGGLGLIKVENSELVTTTAVR